MVLQRLFSDHGPFALHCGLWEHNKSYFKFDGGSTLKALWKKIREWWESFAFTGGPDYILGCKLKALKGKLEEWSRTNLAT